MKDQFSHYMRPDDDEIKKAWENAIFILDANVLLNLYRYPEDARESLISVLEKVDSIWIPHQAALEFYENKETVIDDQLSKFTKVQQLLDTSVSTLRNRLENLQLEKRHSLIEPQPIVESVEALVSKIKSDLQEQEEQQKSSRKNDVVQKKLNSILNGKVGSPPQDQNELNELYKDGEYRYEHEIPPGYKDAKKRSSDSSSKKTYIFDDLVFERKFGDLILWNQILEMAKDDKVKNVIFITDDQKEDWWWIETSSTRRVIGPRPELIQEIRSKSNVENLLMYTSERFLKYASEYFNIDVEDETIQQVRDITDSSNSVPSQSHPPSWKEEDEDIGFFELQEEVEENFSKLVKVINRISSHMNWITERTQEHTKAIQANNEKSNPNSRVFKEIINSSAKDLNEFSSFIESEISHFATLHPAAIETSKYAILLLDDKKQIAQILPSIKKMEDGLEKSISATTGLLNSITDLPRLTKPLNQAKKRAVRILDDLIAEYSKARELTSKTYRELEATLDEDESDDEI